MIPFFSRNWGKSPLDPDYDDDFDEEAAYEKYEEMAELRADLARE